MFEDVLFYIAAFIWGSLFGFLLSDVARKIDEQRVRRRKERKPPQRRLRLGYRFCNNVERWRPLVSEWFKPDDVDRALMIIQRASGGDPNAVGDDGHSVGLFQLHDQGIGLGLGDARYDPETNVAVASAIVYGGLGWAPWRFYEKEPQRPSWWRRRLVLRRA